MKTVYVIARKECKSIVFSPIFLVIAGFCTLVWSYGYVHSVIGFASKSMNPQSAPGVVAPSLNLHYSIFVTHISYVNLILLFAIPALTMKLLADEKRQRTFDLLATCPITSTDIALGKFFGGYVSALTLIGISFLYPLYLMVFTDLSWGPLFTSYLGVVLMAGIYVSVGLFSSSITSSPVLAVILGIVFNMMIWFLGQGTELVSHGIMADVFRHVSIGDHFLNFLKGTIVVSSTVFLISFAGMLVFLVQRTVEASRWR